MVQPRGASLFSRLRLARHRSIIGFVLHLCFISQKRNAKEEQAQLGGIWLPEGELAEEDDDDEFGDLSDDSDSDSNSEGGGTSDSDESDDDDGGDDDLGFEIVRRSKSKRSKAAELVDADEEDTSVSIASEDAKDASALTRVAESSGPLLQTMLAQSEPIAAKPKRKKATVQVAARNIASDDDDDDDFQCTLTVDSVFRPRSLKVCSICVYL